MTRKGLLALAVTAALPAAAFAGNTVDHGAVALTPNPAVLGNCQIVNATHGEAVIFTVNNTSRHKYIGNGIATLTPVWAPELKRVDILPKIAAAKSAVLGFAIPGMCLSHACSFRLSLPSGVHHEVHCE